MTPTNTTAPTGAQADTPDGESELSTAVAQADDLVPDRVQQLQWIHQARAARLARTAADLKAQYGANDSRVKGAEAAMAAERAVSAELVIAHRQITTPAPDAAANGWSLYGVICDVQGKPIPRLTVCLVDASQSYQSAYGYAYTDDSGRFVLAYEGAKTATGETRSSSGAGQDGPVRASQRSQTTDDVHEPKHRGAPGGCCHSLSRSAISRRRLDWGTTRGSTTGPAIKRKGEGQVAHEPQRTAVIQRGLLRNAESNVGDGLALEWDVVESPGEADFACSSRTILRT